MQHLLLLKNTYYYNRRVPLSVGEYDPRKLIRFSLKTAIKQEAVKQARWHDVQFETYWQKLMGTRSRHSIEHYSSVVERAGLYGFPYKSVDALATGSLEDIVRRLIFIAQQGSPAKQVEAVLGGVKEPNIKLSDVMPKFLELTADVKIMKTEHQYRKWENPRILAMRNLTECIGDKSLTEITRDDILKYRHWWITRFKNEEVKQDTANKHIVYLTTMISRVVEHHKLNLDVKHLFHRISFDVDSGTRPPFASDFIVTVLLNPANLSGMKPNYRAMLEVLAETGVIIAEQLNIQPDDIFLTSEIPHIVVRPNKKQNLKTKYRKRVIPLTGYALDAFKRYPEGFSKFNDNPDVVSTAIGKYLKENKLFPTERHSAYSLRHSFQDRLTNANCPDRIQADLMGHKFNRPLYGEGATLAHKYEWMKRVQLRKYLT